MDANQMNKAADNLRILEAAMVEAAKSGHPGGSMSGTDFLNVLYSNFLVYDPEDPDWFARDRFFLDPGHMSPMLYSVLAMCGKYSIDDLKQFRQWQSATPGHPELDVKRGIENSSGPLGQGHVMAVGAAIAERCIAAHFGEIVSHKIYALISDGGIQEEISQGAGRIAGLLGLSNLIMFFDSNKVQLATMVDVVTNEDTAAKYRAWNWNVIEIDGNDPLEIAGALENAIKETKRPTLIIGNTIMGKGCVTADGKNFEFKCSTHGNPISKSGASYEKTVENLGGGGGMIVFGVGLIEGTPEQALWQAYIFNFGSKVGGGGTIMAVEGAFYNVNTGAYEWGGAPPMYGHPNWGKGANHWFDDVSDKIVVELPSIMNEIVREAIALMFSTGRWQLKGHRVTVKL